MDREDNDELCLKEKDRGSSCVEQGKALRNESGGPARREAVEPGFRKKW